MSSYSVEELLVNVMAHDIDGGSFPGRLCTACQRALPVDGAGIALMSDQGPAGLVAATDGALEDLQYNLGEGPGVGDALLLRAHAFGSEQPGSPWPKTSSQNDCVSGAERQEIEVAAAFTVIRTHAREHGRRITEVAAQIIDGTLDTTIIQATGRS